MRKLEDLETRIKDAYRQKACQIPLNKITVASLCDELGISRKAFYTRFESRELVLDAILYDDLVDPIIRTYPILRRSVDSDTSSQILNEQVYRSIAENREFYTRLVSLNEESLVNHALQKCFNKAQDFSREFGDVQESEEYGYAACFLAAGQAAVIMRWLRTGMRAPVSEIAAWFNDLSARAVLIIGQG